MESFWAWFRWLHDATGINLTIFYDPFDRGRFVSGFLMTVKLSAVCIVASVLIGIGGAWLQRSRLRFTRHVVYWYIQFFRNTPPLVQLYFFYFGVGSLLTTAGVSGAPVPMVSNVAWAIVSLVLLRRRVQRGDFPLRHRGGAARRRSRRPNRWDSAGCGRTCSSCSRSRFASACRRSTTTW